MLELEREILSQPPYLFHRKKFTSFEAVSKAFDKYFGSNNKNFYARRNDKLPEKWQQVLENNDHYVIN